MRVNPQTTALAGAPALGGLVGPWTSAVPAQSGPFYYHPASGYYATRAGLVYIPTPGDSFDVPAAASPSCYYPASGRYAPATGTVIPGPGYYFYYAPAAPPADPARRISPPRAAVRHAEPGCRLPELLSRQSTL